MDKEKERLDKIEKIKNLIRSKETRETSEKLDKLIVSIENLVEAVKARPSPQIITQMPAEVHMSNFEKSPSEVTIKNLPEFKKLDIENFPEVQKVEIINHKDIFTSIRVNNLPNPDKIPAWIPSILKVFFQTLSDLLGKVASKVFTIKLAEGEREIPQTVVLLGKDGKFADLNPIIKVTGGFGGGSSAPVQATNNGEGTITVTTAGTRVQLSADQPCKRVFVQSHETNGELASGLVVIGGSGVVAASIGRKGLALYPTNGQWFEVNNINRLYVDAVDDGAKVHYYYEI